MRRAVAVAVLIAALSGCSAKLEVSIMKQWDRPAERAVVVTEDVMRDKSSAIDIPKSNGNVAVQPQGGK